MTYCVPAAAYWVEADTTVKLPRRVIGYSVWHMTDESGRTRVGKFSKQRAGGLDVALHLANTLRDDLNKRIK